MNKEGRINYVPVVIRAGQTLSETTYNLGGRMLKGMLMPDAWDGAALTFQGTRNNSQGNPDTSLLQDVYDDSGGPLSVTVAPSRYIVFGAVLAAKMSGLDFIRVRASVAQGVDRTLVLVTAVSTI